NRDQAMRNLPADTTPQQRNQIRRELDDVRSSSASSASSTLTATKRKLEDEYDDLVADLTRAARKPGASLETAGALPIKVGQAGPFTHRALQRHPAGALPSDKLMGELQEQAERRFAGPAGDLLHELSNPSNDLDEVTEMLERARGLGLEPHTYAETLE